MELFVTIIIMNNMQDNDIHVEKENKKESYTCAVPWSQS